MDADLLKLAIEVVTFIGGAIALAMRIGSIKTSIESQISGLSTRVVELRTEAQAERAETRTAIGDLTKQQAALDKTVSTSGAYVMAVRERTDRISSEVTRAGEKLEAVSARVEGLSSSYGPKLAEHSERLTRLEAERLRRRNDGD